jgi:uncharacterized protein YidB (DUF937 family)
MDISSIAKGLIAQKLGGNNEMVGDVMNSLIGGGDKMDLGSLVSGFKDKGLGNVAESWLGDGANMPVSAEQLKEVIGGDKIAAAASQLGTDEGSLLGSLQDAVPQLVDKASSGGSLLGSLGGIGGIAKKFL